MTGRAKRFAPHPSGQVPPGGCDPDACPRGPICGLAKAAAGPALQAGRQGKAGEGAHLAAAPCPLLLLPQLLHPLLAPQPLKALRRGVAQPPHVVACGDPGGGERHGKGGGWGWCAATTRAGACQRREDACLALAQATRCSGSPAVCREGLQPPTFRVELAAVREHQADVVLQIVHALIRPPRQLFCSTRRSREQGVGTDLRGCSQAACCPTNGSTTAGQPGAMSRHPVPAQPS